MKPISPLFNGRKVKVHKSGKSARRGARKKVQSVRKLSTREQLIADGSLCNW